MSDVIRRVTITGRVQGVGYRAWVEHEARARGLEGWVRNRRDGTVETLFAGRADIVSEMVARCRKGPSSANVESAKDEPGTREELNERRTGERFSLLPTT
jgi:acylphosphatase